MGSRKWHHIVYLHAVLFLWALGFLVCLFIPGGGRIAGILAIGNYLFLFLNIPLAIFSFVLRAKNRLDAAYKGTIAVLSILNTLVGIAAWLSVILLLQKT